MKYLCAAVLIVTLCGASRAQPPAGETLPDGTILYTLDFGTIARKPDGKVAMTLAGAKDRLSIDAAGFKIEEMKSKTGGIMFATAPNPEGIIMSAYFERVRKVASASDCRAFYFPRALEGPPPKINARKKDDGALAIGAYTIVETRGDLKIAQENFNIYLFGSGYCADVHMSKVNYEPEKDGAALQRITQSIALAPAGG